MGSHCERVYKGKKIDKEIGIKIDIKGKRRGKEFVSSFFYLFELF